MTARLMLSDGMLTALAAAIAVRRRAFESGSPPPLRAAIMISLMTRVKTWPRLESVAAFLCLMVAHLECPDIRNLSSAGNSAASQPKRENSISRQESAPDAMRLPRQTVLVV